MNEIGGGGGDLPRSISVNLQKSWKSLYGATIPADSGFSRSTFYVIKPMPIKIQAKPTARSLLSY
jgi:hypothetical protein